jgi:presenilin 1
MAWQLGQFPEWTTWALVVVLAFYDLCAVLTPCGPLKWLVQLVQKEGRPLPGLLYEAEIRIEPPVPLGDQNVPTSPLPISQTKYYQAEASSCNTTKAKPSTGTARRNSNNTHTSEQRHHLLKQRLIRFYQDYNPNAIKRVDNILDRYEGKEEKLWEDLYHKYIAQEEEPGNTIKLGLGDFVFYSVLVSRAAQYELSSMIACLTAILMGLGGTLFLLGIYKKALPALPISILLGVVTYFWVRGCFVSFANSRLDSSVVF